MTTKPLLSIVTITKNDAEGFSRTSRSMDRQTYRDFEWVVIDGNRESDSGIYNAMNKGLGRANGEYILFLNGGDEWADPETLSLIARHIDVYPSDFIYGDAMEFDGERFYIKRARSHHKITRGMFTHHQAMIYRRSSIGNMVFDENYKIAGDYDFTARYLIKAAHVTYIPAPLCLFAGGGASQNHAGLGRKEELMSKILLWPEKKFSHIMVYLIQCVAFGVRKLLPSLYFFLKKY